MPISPEQREKDLIRLHRWLSTIYREPEKYLILDTETTGLNPCEIIELAAIDLRGEILFNQRFNPRTQISDGATACHGIYQEDLADSPKFVDEWGTLRSILQDKILIIYNAEFDLKAIAHSLKIWKIPHSLNFKYFCLMQWYSVYRGQWNQKYGNYTWPKLGGCHSALGDCFRCLEILQEMKCAYPPHNKLKPFSPLKFESSLSAVTWFHPETDFDIECPF